MLSRDTKLCGVLLEDLPPDATKASDDFFLLALWHWKFTRDDFVQRLRDRYGISQKAYDTLFRSKGGNRKAIGVMLVRKMMSSPGGRIGMAERVAVGLMAEDTWKKSQPQLQVVSLA
jgi:hypothetical protein